jgi:hypothetical protein
MAGSPKLNLPLPHDHPNAVSTLRNKRAAIAGEIAMHNREIARLRAELVHLDATMRLFDPATDPDDIPALKRYPRRTEWFARGEVSQRVWEALREQELIWPLEIAKAAMEAKGIPDTDKAVARDIIGRFTNVCYDLTRRGKLGREPINLPRGRLASVRYARILLKNSAVRLTEKY